MNQLRTFAMLLLLLSAQLLFSEAHTDSATISSSGGTGFLAVSGNTGTFEELISGSPATVSILLQGCMTGGTCDTLETNTSTSAQQLRKPSITAVYLYFKVTASWTGGTNVSVKVNATVAAAASPANLGLSPGSAGLPAVYTGTNSIGGGTRVFYTVATDGTGNYNATGTADQVPIQAAITAANAAGGGSVLIQAGVYHLSACVQPKNNVRVIGITPGLTTFDGQSDDYWTFDNTGTLLVGDAGESAFCYNNGSSTNPAGYASTNALSYASFENLGFKNFTRAFDIGSQDLPGLYFSKVSNVYVSGSSDWGLHFENFSEDVFEKVFTVSNTTGDQWYASTVNLANYQPGNSKFQQLYSSPLNNLARGIVFAAPGAESNSKSSLNSIKVHDLQVNRFRDTLTSQTITPTNASTSIAVTDLTKFAVGMPFWVTSTADGYTQNLTYFVTSVSGASGAGTITAATSATGTNISASAGTALTMNSYGFCNMEVQGSASTVSPSTVVGSDFDGLDLEANSGGGSTGLICAERATVTHFRLSAAVFSGGQSAFTFRTVTSLLLDDMHTLSSDIDATSSNVLWPGTRGTVLQRIARGLYFDNAVSAWALTFGNASTATPDVYQRAPTGGNFFYPANSGFGVLVRTQDTSATLGGNHCGSVLTFNGAAGQTFTLPAIDNASTKSTSIQGCRITVVNASANTLAIATSSSQTLNNVGAKTTTTMAANSTLVLYATQTAGGTLYWGAQYNATALP